MKQLQSEIRWMDTGNQAKMREPAPAETEAVKSVFCDGLARASYSDVPQGSLSSVPL